MTNKRIFITDKEIASVIECSVSAVSRFASGFVRGGTVRRKTKSARTVNLKDVKPISVNGMRRWNASSVANALGITEDELWKRIS